MRQQKSLCALFAAPFLPLGPYIRPTDLTMSQDDVQVKNFLIQTTRSRPMFCDKSREDFNDFKTMAASKQEWLGVLDEGRD